MPRIKETSYFIKNSKVNLRKNEKTLLFFELFLKEQVLRKTLALH